MPCSKCRADFNLFNWKIKCGECEDKYCNKCLKRRDGILYCEKCVILLKRPPDRLKLMELKSKDLQDYLNKHNISTYGLVEKHELVDLFCDKHIPQKQRKGVEKLTANFAGSVPNLRPINEFLGNLESVITEQRTTRSGTTSPTSRIPEPKPRAPPPPRPADVQQPTTSQESQNSQSQPPPPTEKNTPESSPLPERYPKLKDFASVEELNSLSPKQLKILLTINRVDFKGCVEKTELLDRAKRLWLDKNEQNKELPDHLPAEELCKLCMDAPLDCVLLECGHIATCIDCGKILAECPICRQYVIRVVRTFKA